jgi:hypothetical protein
VTDNFEKAKDDILKRTASNGGPKPIDLLQAMTGLAQDQDNDHAESMGVLKALADQFTLHQAEANVRDVEIDALQAWRTHSAETCQERIYAIVKPICDELHGSVHQRHLDESHGGSERRADDPLDSKLYERRQPTLRAADRDDRSFRELLMAWSATKKILAVVGSALVLILVGLSVSYVGGYFAARRAENASIQVEKTAIPQPTVTVTATPGL